MANQFDESSTTNDVLQGLDLSGRHALITGASGGLGAETGRALASAGARVTLAARDLAKAEAVAEEIRAGGAEREVEVTALELTSLDSVRDCAKRFLSRNEQFDILINNAGVMACDLTRTPEGWELQMATNHIGHFLLTCKLAPALQRGDSARVINLSSAGHRFGGVDFEDPHFESRAYDKWLAYGQSKTANILFTLELDRRLSGSGVRSIAVHPGMIMTDLGRHMTKQDVEDLMGRASSAGGSPSFKSVEQGAATTAWAASSPELKDLGGIYCEDCNVASEKADEGTAGGISSHALDEEAARQLWTLSEKWVGESFSLN